MRLNSTRRLFLLSSAAVLAGCATKFPTYGGPEVTRLEVYKAQRRLYLFSGDSVLRAYDVDLGFAPVGHKQFDGDGKTPEGSYIIDRRNPDSDYFLSIGISYPNEADMAYALAQGREPGGDIFIHGGPRPRIDPAGPDWTAGCVSVTDPEIREIYSIVRDGTPIDIYL